MCYNTYFQGKIKGNPPPVGLEPTTFELEVQHASPLRHGGFRYKILSFYYPDFIVLFFETKIFLTVFIFYTSCSSI